MLKQPLEVFCERGVLRNFKKFTGKTCASLFFKKLQASPNFIKKRLWHWRFPVNFVKEHLFLQNTSGDCYLIWKKNNKKFTYSSNVPKTKQCQKMVLSKAPNAWRFPVWLHHTTQALRVCQAIARLVQNVSPDYYI